MLLAISCKNPFTTTTLKGFILMAPFHLKKEWCVCVCMWMSNPIKSWWYKAAAAAKSLQSCPTLCDPIDGSPPGSPVPEILQARVLQWGGIKLRLVNYGPLAKSGLLLVFKLYCNIYNDRKNYMESTLFRYREKRSLLGLCSWKDAMGLNSKHKWRDWPFRRGKQCLWYDMGRREWEE